MLIRFGLRLVSCQNFSKIMFTLVFSSFLVPNFIEIRTTIPISITPNFGLAFICKFGPQTKQPTSPCSRTVLELYTALHSILGRTFDSREQLHCGTDVRSLLKQKIIKMNKSHAENTAKLAKVSLDQSLLLLIQR